MMFHIIGLEKSDCPRITEVFRGTMGKWIWHLFEQNVCICLENAGRKAGQRLAE